MDHEQLVECATCTDHCPPFFDEFGTRILRSRLFIEKANLPGMFSSPTVAFLQCELNLTM
jgi:hypothetical protein